MDSDATARAPPGVKTWVNVARDELIRSGSSWKSRAAPFSDTIWVTSSARLSRAASMEAIRPVCICRSNTTSPPAARRIVARR
ncbi:hypothetical protein ACFQX6_12790 [Streptosporangium lutulentum]